MKKDRKFARGVMLFILCILTLSFVACSNGEGEKDGGNATDAPTVTEKADDNGKNDADNGGKTEENKGQTGKKPTGKPGGNVKTEPTPVVETAKESISALAKEQNEKETKATDTIDVELTFNSDGTYKFEQDNRFYENDVRLTITAPSGAKVYYTLDGREPTLDSRIYAEPLLFQTQGGEFPDAYTLRACMINPDGTTSKIAARSYLVSRGAEKRFSTLVFMVSGDPDDLTEEPNGILYGDNAFERGRESERMVYIEAFEADGTPIFAQYGGVRVYGGYSRNSTVKSLKLFSRKSYDEDHKNFKIDTFNTPKLYETEEGKSSVITKYDKLVLRNGGNDFQFAFIRDELSQALCKRAGFETYEACVPAVVYLDGSYYAFDWLHENYCDKYFKERFGDGEGEFIILEGEDQVKDDDDELQSFVDEYNSKYKKYAYSDLTNDSLYNELCEYIDINSYLDFFAWNIALNNWDWPNNNFKCFRYVPAEGEALREGVFDGKWRFLPHDMDYTYSIYDQAKAKENYNTLRVVMDENNERYSPLFTALMQRKDCRDYFRAKTYEYINGAQSEKAIKEEYEKLHASRKQELAHFYNFIQVLNRRGDWTMWTRPENYAGTEKGIYTFAEKRAGYVIKYMEELLPEL